MRLLRHAGAPFSRVRAGRKSGPIEAGLPDRIEDAPGATIRVLAERWIKRGPRIKVGELNSAVARR